MPPIPKKKYLLLLSFFLAFLGSGFVLFLLEIIAGSVIPIVLNTSIAICSAAAGHAKLVMFSFKAFSWFSSCTNSIIEPTNSSLDLSSVIIIAAFFSTRAIAFFLWWSSDTFGEGTNMHAFFSRLNSEIELAPARDTTKSAIA